MHDWRKSLRRTKNAIISWAGSIHDMNTPYEQEMDSDLQSIHQYFSYTRIMERKVTVKGKHNEHTCRLNLLHEGHCNNYVQAPADILRENNTKTGLPGFHCYMPLSWQRLLGRRTLNICIATADQLRMYCPIIGTNFIIFEYSIY